MSDVSSISEFQSNASKLTNSNDSDEDEDEPLIKFKLEPTLNEVQSKAESVSELPKPSNLISTSDLQRNRHQGWPVEATKTLLSLRFEKYGHEIKEFSDRADHLARLWSRLVTEFNETFPGLYLTVTNAKRNISRYEERYVEGLSRESEKRPPNWKLYAKYFAQNGDSLESSSGQVYPQANNDGYENVTVLSSSADDLETSESNENRLFEIGACIVKLRMSTFRARFEASNKHSRIFLWKEITDLVNDAFKLDLTSKQVQKKYNRKKTAYINNRMSKHHRDFFSEFFESESVENAADRNEEGVEPASKKRRLSIETVRGSVNRPAIQDSFLKRRQDELRALNDSIQKAADILSELIMF